MNNLTKVTFFILQVEVIREKALAEVFAEFEEKLEAAIALFRDSNISDQDIEVVQSKFKDSFQNYFTTGFDTVFQKELNEKWLPMVMCDAFLI